MIFSALINACFGKFKVVSLFEKAVSETGICFLFIVEGIQSKTVRYSIDEIF